MYLMSYFLTWLRSREEGQGLVEYALILALIAVVVIVVLLILGPQIGRVFSRIITELTNAGVP